ncbi:MAG: Gfo/Idh/MocA family oxidoreductase, partial [Candidatus Sulfotelmatobacter sp.]
SAGWASLSPAFQFEDDRKLTGRIGKRHFERTFKTVDEFAPEIDAFAKAIQGHGLVEPDGIQGHRDIIIIDAIYKSARNNTSIAIEY